MMTKKFRDEWIAALRDPEAKQTKGALQRSEGMCCMGVRLRMDVDAGHVVHHATDDGTICFADTGTSGLLASGSPSVVTLRRWGVEGEIYPHPNGRYSWPLQAILADLNDCHEWTFPQIADYIESLPYRIED